MTTWSDDLTACAQIVERGDPWRFRTVMAAPPEARKTLFPLYAFNVEVSRAPWVTQEPMIAEMRLQWWRDVLEEIRTGGTVRKHEVATPLAGILCAEDANALDALVTARQWDAYREPFENAAALDRYIDESAGHLMWVAARLCGATAEQESGIRHLGYGAGLAGFLRAIPALEAAGRIPLVDGTPEGVKALGRRGLERLAQGPRRGGVALWPAIGARRCLTQVVRDPAAVAQGRLGAHSGAAGLLWASLTGRI
jgi:phytoene/squalene synthetase